MGKEESGKSGSLEDQSILYIVDFSMEFNLYYDKVWSPEKLDLIDDFIEHYETNGLRNWKGKISKSSNVPNNYKDAALKKALAEKYNLYHAHIGFPSWTNIPKIPYSTSDQVLHFQKLNSNSIKLLTLSTHNPMDLPSEDNIQDFK